MTREDLKISISRLRERRAAIRPFDPSSLVTAPRAGRRSGAERTSAPAEKLEFDAEE